MILGESLENAEGRAQNAENRSTGLGEQQGVCVLPSAFCHLRSVFF